MILNHFKLQHFVSILKKIAKSFAYRWGRKSSGIDLHKLDMENASFNSPRKAVELNPNPTLY
jgi:hypothetical protein